MKHQVCKGIMEIIPLGKQKVNQCYEISKIYLLGFLWTLTGLSFTILDGGTFAVSGIVDVLSNSPAECSLSVLEVPAKVLWAS